MQVCIYNWVWSVSFNALIRQMYPEVIRTNGRRTVAPSGGSHRLAAVVSCGGSRRLPPQQPPLKPADGDSCRQTCFSRLICIPWLRPLLENWKSDVPRPIASHPVRICSTRQPAIVANELNRSPTDRKSCRTRHAWLDRSIGSLCRRCTGMNMVARRTSSFPWLGR